MRFSRFAYEPIQLSTGGVQRVLFRFGDARADQWPAVACDELSKGVFDVQPCQLGRDTHLVRSNDNHDGRW